MTFPARFITISICLTFIACGLIRELAPLAGKILDLQVLESIREIQKGAIKPNQFTL